MDKNEIIRIVKIFALKVANEFLVKKVILFGSYANETFTENSDIDVAVVLKGLEDDLLTSEFRLYKIRRDIDHRIEPVIFIENEDKSGFLQEIYRTGTIVYSAA